MDHVACSGQSQPTRPGNQGRFRLVCAPEILSAYFAFGVAHLASKSKRLNAIVDEHQLSLASTMIHSLTSKFSSPSTR
jgi:hypothetical protein